MGDISEMQDNPQKSGLIKIINAAGIAGMIWGYGMAYSGRTSQIMEPLRARQAHELRIELERDFYKTNFVNPKEVSSLKSKIDAYAEMARNPVVTTYHTESQAAQNKSDNTCSLGALVFFGGFCASILSMPRRRRTFCKE